MNDKRKRENTIAELITKDISDGRIKMLPRIYFVVGSALLVVGVVTAFVVSSTFFGLLFLRIETELPILTTHLRWLDTVPWEYALAALISFILGAILLRKSEISYKSNLGLILLGALLASVLTGFLIKEIGPTRNQLRRVPYHRRMQVRGIMTPNQNLHKRRMK